MVCRGSLLQRNTQVQKKIDKKERVVYHVHMNSCSYVEIELGGISMAEKEHSCGCCHGHEHHEHHDHCNCGHDHQDHCECGHEHHHDSCGCGCGCGCGHDHHEDKKELPLLLLGAGLFAAGILVDLLLKNQWFSLPVFVAAYLVLGWEVLLTAGKNIVKGRVFDENFLMRDTP